MSLVTPLVKDPVELAFNYSFFFRDQIERDTSPLVSAPAYVGKFSDAAKKVAYREDQGQEVRQDGVGLAGESGLRRARRSGHPELRAAVRHSRPRSARQGPRRQGARFLGHPVDPD
jgi:hypothetical protein